MFIENLRKIDVEKPAFDVREPRFKAFKKDDIDELRRIEEQNQQDEEGLLDKLVPEQQKQQQR